MLPKELEVYRHILGWVDKGIRVGFLDKWNSKGNEERYYNYYRVRIRDIARGLTYKEGLEIGDCYIKEYEVEAIWGAFKLEVELEVTGRYKRGYNCMGMRCRGCNRLRTNLYLAYGGKELRCWRCSRLHTGYFLTNKLRKVLSILQRLNYRIAVGTGKVREMRDRRERLLRLWGNYLRKDLYEADKLLMKRLISKKRRWEREKKLLKVDIDRRERFKVLDRKKWRKYREVHKEEINKKMAEWYRKMDNESKNELLRKNRERRKVVNMTDEQRKRVKELSKERNRRYNERRRKQRDSNIGEQRDNGAREEGYNSEFKGREGGISE